MVKGKRFFLERHHKTLWHLEALRYRVRCKKNKKGKKGKANLIFNPLNFMQFYKKVVKLAGNVAGREPQSIKESWRWMKNILHERETLKIKCN